MKHVSKTRLDQIATMLLVADRSTVYPVLIICHQNLATFCI